MADPIVKGILSEGIVPAELDHIKIAEEIEKFEGENQRAPRSLSPSVASLINLSYESEYNEIQFKPRKRCRGSHVGLQKAF
ncbi:hypothetical protein BDBG_16395 [Blastomyces gilchristii SLH14081]|uniref:Uncharacterized protein n=1 Tax=Blastomyces gilchristii (strain SLH14081) TaxID=559298 RepID=A0A179UAK6_BLAGS|nr:uncharacterized protein BDBG_16395 [Blastomyces gilchristii SLH14081]OAT05046.1 hypothetical protein BDBG_16395 [Blastomyces gilchristii SLH14081]